MTGAFTQSKVDMTRDKRAGCQPLERCRYADFTQLRAQSSQTLSADLCVLYNEPHPKILSEIVLRETLSFGLGRVCDTLVRQPPCSLSVAGRCGDHKAPYKGSCCSKRLLWSIARGGKEASYLHAGWWLLTGQDNRVKGARLITIILQMKLYLSGADCARNLTQVSIRLPRPVTNVFVVLETLEQQGACSAT